MCISICTFCSCLKVESFVQEVFTYEPYGEQISIASLKQLGADKVIDRELYVQGVVTSTDKEGNYSQKIVFQDESGAIAVCVDMSMSNKLFPEGQKISVQCKGMMLAEVGGVLSLAAGVKGSGLQKTAVPIDNRSARSSVFAVSGGERIVPSPLGLPELDPVSRKMEYCLVSLQNVFFQTDLLPYANEGGSSEQFRTLCDGSGHTALLCTSDGATMAGDSLPLGMGSITGVLTYPNGKSVLMIRSLEDVDFDPSSPGGAADPDDRESGVMLSEYYASDGAYYIEVTNVGNEYVDLSDYCLASDNASDGIFSKKIVLDDNQIGPFGMAVYFNGKGADKFARTTSEWDALRTNYSSVSLDSLALDGNSQVALMKGDEIVDILATTDKFGWAQNRTLIRRQGIVGHSSSNDFTRADAGWITKVEGYAYNLGNHRFYDYDPDFDSPLPAVPYTVLGLRAMPKGLITEAAVIKGRVTSDREGGNVASGRLFMQDESNRGICIAFREGQIHSYDAGDEISVNLYGASLVDENGLLVVADAVVSRSERTGSPNQMPEPVEASVSQIENLQSMYILVKDVQVADEDLYKQYGDGYVLSEDLFANTFYISSGKDAVFADSWVSQMSGTVKGIAGVDGDMLMVMPRNGNDLQGLDSGRFVAITAAPITVEDMKRYGDGMIRDDVRVTVTVLSDNSDGNMPSDKVFVSDSDNGFVLNVPGGENRWKFGQSLIVVLDGAEVGSSDEFVVSPASESSVVPVGAPDPSYQPVSIVPSQIKDNLYRLVTIEGVQVDESCRLERFSGSRKFNCRGLSSSLYVQTSGTASWNGGYIPLASGAITGLVTRSGNDYVIYPRNASDLSLLPKNGKRLDGEKVVYFVPSTDPAADLFISETVMGDLDANGTLLGTVARNKCNSKFVELYNPTASDLILSDYRVACIKYNNSVARGDVRYYRFPDNLVLTPGRTVVFKYVSSANGTGNTSFMTNTLWPKDYNGDKDLKDGVKVDEDSVPGVILVLDARDYSKNIANSVSAFPAFDGNDILVVQKTSDGGATWTEIDRLFSLPTKDGSFTGGVVYPFLKGYQRKPGMLGLPGGVTDVQDPAYDGQTEKRNRNDFESVWCNPVAEGAAYWTPMSLGDVEDLGVHTFSVE